MAGMDQVVGSQKIGENPNTNPSPVAPPPPMPAAPPQQAQQSPPALASQQAPAQAPPQQAPQPQQQPADPVTQESKEVDALFNQVMPKKEASNEDHAKSVDDLFQSVGLGGDSQGGPIDPQKPGENFLQYQVRKLPEQLQFIGAQMRSKLYDTPEKRKMVFQSMYGENNAKLDANKDLWFRQDDKGKFKKADQGNMADFAVYNTLHVLPIIANMLTQGAADIGGGLPGMAASGAMGGAAEAATNSTLQQSINAFTSLTGGIPIAGDDAMAALKTIGKNTVAAPILGPVAKGAVVAGQAVMGVARNAATDLGASLSNAFPAAADALTQLGQKGVAAVEREAGAFTTKLAMVNQSFKKFVKTLYPQITDFEDPKQFSEKLAPVFDKAEARLQQSIQTIKSDVIATAGDTMAPMDNAMTGLQKTLKRYGYTPRTELNSGGLTSPTTTGGSLRRVPLSSSEVIPHPVEYATKTESFRKPLYADNIDGLAQQFGTEAAERESTTISKFASDSTHKRTVSYHTIGSGPDGQPGEMVLTNPQRQNNLPGDVRSTLAKLQSHYNYLLSRKQVEGGIPAAEMFDHAEDLGKSAFEPKYSDASRELYTQVWKNHAADRDTFINGIYGGVDTEAAKTYHIEYGKFSDQIDGVRQFQTMLKTQGAQETFLNAMLGGNKAERANLLDAARATLKDTPEVWNGLQGQMVNSLVSKFSTPGYLQANELLQYMNNAANKPVLNRMFEGNGLNEFKQMVLGTQQILKTGRVSGTQANIIDRGVQFLFRSSSEPGQAVLNFFKATGGDEVQVHYLQNEGFQKLIEKAEDPEMQAALMKGRRLLDGIVAKMPLAEMQSTAERSVAKNVRRFVGVTAPAASAVVKILLQ